MRVQGGGAAGLHADVAVRMHPERPGTGKPQPPTSLGCACSFRPSRRTSVRAYASASGGGGKKITQNEFTEKAWQVCRLLGQRLS
jgi:hypothetical protein